MRSLRSYLTLNDTFMPRHPVQYLASPYTDYSDGLDAAYEAAGRANAMLALSGVHVFCPIVYGHALAQFMPAMTHDWWLDWCRPHMDAAAGIIVLQLPGWEKSLGIFAEREVFRMQGKPEHFLGWPVHASTSVDDLRVWFRISGGYGAGAQARHAAAVGRTAR